MFLDQEALKSLPAVTPVWNVRTCMPVTEGTPGGLFFGTSTIMPGKDGNKYFMTKEHFHSQSDRNEFDWVVQGKMMIILMDRDQNTMAEEVYPGSIPYIGAKIAHRLINTGSDGALNTNKIYK